MIQYKKTRPEATNEGIKHAKEFTKFYIKNVPTIHPLVLGMDPKRCNGSLIQKIDFIKTLQTFRPQTTVLETSG